MVLRWLLALLVVVTLAGLYANEYGMTRRLVLDGRGAGQQLRVQDDRGSGGASEARLAAVAGGGAEMRCEIRAGFAWPYCELQIAMARDLDARAFGRIRLWLSADGPQQGGGPAQVRVFLRNFDPGYAPAGEAATLADLKPHEVVFAPGEQPRPVELRLSQFMISSWWSQNHPLPVPLMGPQLNRVRVFSISTGGQVVPGTHVIRLERAELLGHWVAPETFRLGLLGLWMLSGLGYLAWDAWVARRRLRSSLRRSDTLEQLALTDPLTNVANREGLHRALDLLIQVQGELTFPLSVVFVDADHFKQINDTQGHDVGDQVLVRMAQTLRANLPRDDLLARWGGEEFVIVMPQTPADEAESVAERLRQVLARTEWPAALTVTASWGVAEATSADELETALREADQAMYRAKHAGRDRVMSAST